MIQSQISFDGIDESEALRFAVQERIEKLERFFDRIVRCEVKLSIPHRHRQNGRLGHVRIHLHIPGNDIVVSRDPEKQESHQDIYLAVRDAFDSAERMLEEQVRKRRKTPIKTARRSRNKIS